MKRIKLLFFSLLIYSLQVDAHPAWGIVVDGSGNIYFADVVHNSGSIWKLSSTGQLTLLLDHFHAHNVSLDANGDLISAHGEGNHTMVRIIKDKSLDTIYHTLDYKEFFGGNCTWTTNGEILYGLREHKYLRLIDKNGLQKNFGDYPFNWNQTVYSAPDGTIYAPDIGVDNGIVVKIDSTGKSEIIAKDLISKLDRPKDKHNDILLGIKESAQGIIYVAETAGRRIIKILKNGTTETFYKSEGNWFPTGIEFHRDNAYILEFKGNTGPRIIKMDLAGNKYVIFNYETYLKDEVPPINSPNKGNRNWWIYCLTGIAVLVLILGTLRTKTCQNN